MSLKFAEVINFALHRALTSTLRRNMLRTIQKGSLDNSASLQKVISIKNCLIKFSFRRRFM